MKVLFTSLMLVLSFSIFSAECLDTDRNVIDGSVSGLKRILKSYEGDRVQVHVTGKIISIAREDRKGSRHQKFNIRINKEYTFQIINNLGFGRIPLKIGKTISVCGEYKKVGRGMVHWTHFDPRGTHPDGFTILDGVLYGDTEEDLIESYEAS